MPRFSKKRLLEIIRLAIGLESTDRLRPLVFAKLLLGFLVKATIHFDEWELVILKGLTTVETRFGRRHHVIVARAQAAGVASIAIMQRRIEEANDSLALELHVNAGCSPGELTLSLARYDPAASRAGLISRTRVQVAPFDCDRVPFDFDLLRSFCMVAALSNVWIRNRDRTIR